MRTELLFATALAAILQACSADNAPTGSADDKDKMTSADQATTTVTDADRNFAHDAAMGGMAEVELGRLAADKGSDPKVKDFGQQMVDDHGKANDELKNIARSLNIALPSDLDAAHKDKKDELDQHSGSDFDRAYVDAMVDGHKKALDLFQKEAANGSNALVKNFASKTADVIQMHLSKIQEIQQGMK